MPSPLHLEYDWQARGFKTPAESAKPCIRRSLRGTPKGLAANFYQLASSHPMVPFLKEHFGWIESDIYCWCGTGRQTRAHLFKKYITWRKKIKMLWGGGGSGRRQEGWGRASTEGKEWLGSRVRCEAGPGTTVRELLSEERYVAAVLDFLKATKVEMVKIT